MNLKSNFIKFCTWMLGMMLAVMCLFAEQTVNAQSGSYPVSGTVFDSDGIPLMGASVIEKGTQNGTIADIDGKFALKVASAKSVVIVSFIGMNDQEVIVGEGQNLSVTLSSNSELDELVFIAYGVQKKSDLTGSVSTFKDKDMQDRMVLSVEDAIRGRIAGVTVSSNDGSPGESLNMRIRGTGSINASNSPLYVIDGVPMDECDINPGDIASLEVLKDASSTAIYGSRGANGVVIITTHKGAKGRPRINLSINSGLQTPVRLIDMAESWEYQEYRYRGLFQFHPEGPNQSFKADRTGYYDRYGNIWSYPTEKDFAHWRETRDNPDATNTDWQKIMLRNTWVHDIRLNVAGGGENNTYSVMGSVLMNEGMVVNSGFDKYSLRANFDQKVNKFFSFGLNVMATKSIQRGTMTNDNKGTIMNMLRQPPTKEFTSNDIFEAEEGEDSVTNNNPWYQAHNVVKKTYKNTVNGKLYLNFTFLKDFRLNISGNYDMGNISNDSFIPRAVAAGRNQNGIVRNSSTQRNNWLNENILYYNPKAWGKHKFDAMAGITFQEDYSRRINVEGQNFEYEGLKENGMNDALTPIGTTYSFTKTRMMSGLLRFNYSFDNRYLFTVSMRADGSSRFGSNNKWAYFPSGAFAWRINNEPFLKNAEWLSNLKLRLSAGVSGNTAIPAYQTLPILDSSNYPFSGADGQVNAGNVLSRISNPDLRWETSTQYDAGLDIGIFKDRFTLTVDAYYKQTRDLLLVEQIPSYTGYTTRWSNVGAVDNAGIEFTLAGSVISTKNFNWTTNFNISTNRSKVVSLGSRNEMILSASGSEANNFAILREGLPIGTWYGYQTDGLFRTQAEIDALPDDYISLGLSKSGITPGRQRYVDQDGNGRIDEEDRVILGNSQPKFMGGWQNEFSYKGFSLNVALEFSYGRKIFNATELSLEKSTGGDNVSSHFYKNRWSPDLYDMNTGKLVWKGNEDGFLPALGFSGPPESYCKDTFIEDGSYLRISDVTLSYDFPKRWMSKIKINGIRLYCSVRNLWLFTNYSGYDPDVNSVGGTTGDLMQGVDSSAYPRSRVFTIGANFSF